MRRYAGGGAVPGGYSAQAKTPAGADTRLEGDDDDGDADGDAGGGGAWVDINGGYGDEGEGEEEDDDEAASSVVPSSSVAASRACRSPLD